MEKVVYLQSDYFNVINFLLFDIVLASLVFYLTADIAGRVNSASALQNLGNRLQPFNPPLVGVGLTCTRRNVFRALALVRACAMLLVLATNFLIEGASVDRKTPRSGNVVVLGKINDNATQVNVRQLMLKRRGCQGRTEDFMYYGQLETNGKCELRLEYIVPGAGSVHFGLKFEQKEIKLTECKKSQVNIVLQFFCKQGVVACLGEQGAPLKVKNTTCRGTLLAPGPNQKDETHLCEGPGIDPEGKGGKVRCRLARNGPHNLTTWVPFTALRARTIRDAYDAVHAAGSKRMQVFDIVENAVPVSEVKWAWFYILGFKVLSIVTLVVIAIVLKCKGYERVANDEFGIGSLLAQSTTIDNADAEEGVGVEGGGGGGDDDRRGGGGGGGGEAGGWVSSRRGGTPTLIVQNEGGILRARAR